MKLTFKRTAITNALQSVAGVVPSKTTKDILKNIKLEVRGRIATLLGSDSEIGMRSVVECESDGDGQCLLPVGRLLSIVRELADELVKTTVDDCKIRIESGGSKFTLTTEDAAGFPEVPDGDFSTCSMITSAALKQLIRRTVFATDVSSTQYALAGVLFEFSSNKLTCVATDTRRLAIMRSDCNHSTDADSCIVPIKALDLLSGCLDDNDAPVSIAITGSAISFSVNGTVITTQHVSGIFPPWRKVIPPKGNARVEMVADPLMRAVRQAQIVTVEESRAVDFRFSREVLRLSSSAANIGQSDIELPIQCDSEISVRIDPKYMSDFLKVVDGGELVTVDLINGDSPILCACGDYQYVVMPVVKE